MSNSTFTGTGIDHLAVPAQGRGLRIALVNPRTDAYSSVLPPLGLLYIAATLEQEGFEVRIFDPLPDENRDLHQVIGFQPDIVGLSILTSYVPRAQQIISLLKKELRGSVFVIGGVHPTVLPKESLSLFSADYVVVGEGEVTMKELCLCIKNGESPSGVKGLAFASVDGVSMTPPREPIHDLDSLPFPARHLLDFERYLFPPGIIRGHWSERSTTVMTSRGCPFHCIWCGTQSIWGRKVRRRSVKNVIAELELLTENYRVDTVWFADDTFTVNKRWTTQFCEAVLERNLQLKWGLQAHVNTLDESTLRKMKRAGLVQLDIGVESGSNRVLKALKKESSEEAIRRAFQTAKKVGVRTMGTFMFGNPCEEMEDVEKTFNVAKEVNPDFVSSFFLTPFPGTELMDMARENKWIQADVSYREGGLKGKPMMQINFSPVELQRIRARFQRQFIFKNNLVILKSPVYLVKVILLLLKFPAGVYRGLKVFLRTGVFDDFTFAFLMYYSAKKQRALSRQSGYHSNNRGVF